MKLYLYYKFGLKFLGMVCMNISRSFVNLLESWDALGAILSKLLSKVQKQSTLCSSGYSEWSAFWARADIQEQRMALALAWGMNLAGLSNFHTH